MGPCPKLACASAAIGRRGISASSLIFLSLVARTTRGVSERRRFVTAMRLLHPGCPLGTRLGECVV